MPGDKKTTVDRLVYLFIGTSVEIVGNLLGGLEKIVSKETPTQTMPNLFDDNTISHKVKTAVKRISGIPHNYSGPMLWLAHYIRGDGSDLTINADSRYYGDWLKSVNKWLVRAVRYDCIDKPDEFDLDDESSWDIYGQKDVALKFLKDGLKYNGSGGDRQGGLFSMIGTAKVYLINGKLESVDTYDFENIKADIAIPKSLRLLFRTLAVVSPMLRRGLTKGYKRIQDEYFYRMGGRIFNTVCSGNLQDLNRYGWKF